MTIIGIAAVAKNGAIGRKGEIPWHYSEDFRFFKQVTANSAITVGLTTFGDTGRLPKRMNVVLSFEPVTDRKDIININSIQQALLLSKYLKNPMFIIGGSSVYKAFIPHVDYWWITHIPLEPDDCDAFMPEGFREGCQEVYRVELAEGLDAVLYEKNRTAYFDQYEQNGGYPCGL